MQQRGPALPHAGKSNGLKSTLAGGSSRARNPYIVFCTEQRPHLQDLKIPSAEIERRLGELWRKLTPESKSRYTLASRAISDWVARSSALQEGADQPDLPPPPDAATPAVSAATALLVSTPRGSAASQSRARHMALRDVVAAFLPPTAPSPQAARPAGKAHTANAANPNVVPVLPPSQEAFAAAASAPSAASAAAVLPPSFVVPGPLPSLFAASSGPLLLPSPALLGLTPPTPVAHSGGNVSPYPTTTASSGSPAGIFLGGLPLQ